jgi:uncharacterized 2Fe-2S/4Fe-4S cluster protein (DUF4445 family)
MAVTTKSYRIDLEPIGRRIEVAEGTNLLEAAQQAGIDLVAACGGIGICGTCRIRQVTGQFSPVSLVEEEQLRPEELAAGYRLACQVEVFSDVRVEIPPESLVTAQRMQVEGQDIEMALDPSVLTFDVALDPPGLQDLRSDLTRVNQALGEADYPPIRADLAVLDSLSQFLRSHDWKARLAIRPDAAVTRLVGALPEGAALLGLAVDMGSTKLAVYLVELATGITLARSGVMNPQISFGEDVVSRIAFANKGEDNRKLLQTRLVETINQSAAELCKTANVQMEQIVDAVVVGNTAMHHFFCGLPVSQLGAAPYVPAVSEALDVRASELGLAIAPGAWVHLPANIAGYVGGDHVAVLLTTQVFDSTKTLVAVDIGTNTEISLVHDHQIYSCSCASGPAFEGAHIHDGMRAAPGAIERVRFSGKDVQVSTIGNTAPVGICGTGILNAISEMLEWNVLDVRGVFDRQDSRVRLYNNKAEFVLAQGAGRDIVVTRQDISEIQLAKGAIRSGLELLLEEAGIPAEAVDDWIIAGAFGTYLDLGSALRVGMFPDMPLERFHQVGNAAGVGAKQMLLSARMRREANQIARQVQYVELTTHPNFTRTFMETMYFPPEKQH